MSPSQLVRNLYVQVLAAIVLGVLLGHFLPAAGIAMKPLGDGFIKLVRMMIAPIVFCTVVTGVAGMESLRAVGRTGGFALVYFEVVSTLALAVGLVIVNLVGPGRGMNVDPATLDTRALGAYAAPGALQDAPGFLLEIIPDSALGALAKGDVLQTLLLALLVGPALRAAGARDILVWIEGVSAVLFRVVGYLMRVAPIGAFGAMAFTIGKYGLGMLAALGELMACFYATCLVFVFGVLGAIARLHGFSLWRFLVFIKEELFIVLGTSSSESVLPRLIDRLRDLGAHPAAAGLVIPAGYSFNLDGTAIYLTMAAVFIAQATNTPLDLTQQLELLAVLLLTSKGAAGVSGSGFVVLAATLSALGHVPVAGLALILGIDRFMSEARALTNVIGNGVAALVVARWCGMLDERRLAARLAGRPAPEDPAT